ncbi:hypothetical protein [Corynebacterium occultum]|uniref:hypothetical protein n=1 Tax=Corynebacterium occultum TaxID=2675219 RepID=UPI0012E1C5BA|nr:hypothetical protein [Corynebacterium occultum]
MDYPLQRQDLTFWTTVTPDDDADIDTTTSHLAAPTGSRTTIIWACSTTRSCAPSNPP